MTNELFLAAIVRHYNSVLKEPVTFSSNWIRKTT